jgi:broad specificity phosphatase PhoE
MRVGAPRTILPGACRPTGTRDAGPDQPVASGRRDGDADRGRLGADVEQDANLREVDVGELDGRTFDETAAAYPDLARQVLAADRDIDWPGGERSEDLRVRADAAWRHVVARAGDGSVVVVTHGGVGGELIASLVESDPAEPRAWLPAGAAVALEPRGDAWVIVERIVPEGATA